MDARARAIEMLRDQMGLYMQDKRLAPLIEAAKNPGFEDRFYGDVAMHIPEYRVIDRQPETSEDWFLPQGGPRNMVFGEGMSIPDPAHKYMAIPNVEESENFSMAKPQSPPTFGGGGYENVTPNSIEELLRQTGGVRPQVPQTFPDLEEFLSPGME